MTKSNLVRAVTFSVGLITILQGLVPAMPLGAETTVLISAILIYVASILTAIKQAVSVEIKTRKALVYSIILVLIATIGGLNDVLNVVHLNDLLAQWLRFGITGSILILNLASKTLFPTEEGQVIEKIKDNLSK